MRDPSTIYFNEKKSNSFVHARYIFRIRKSIPSRYTCAPVRASSSLLLPRRYGIIVCGRHISLKSRAVTDEVMKTNVYQNG